MLVDKYRAYIGCYDTVVFKQICISRVSIGQYCAVALTQRVMTRVRLGRYDTAILKDGCIYSGATVGVCIMQSTRYINSNARGKWYSKFYIDAKLKFTNLKTVYS